MNMMKKCKVTVKISRVEGLPPAGTVAVKVKWRQQGLKVSKTWRSLGKKVSDETSMTRERMVSEGGVVQWDEDDIGSKFDSFLCFKDSSMLGDSSCTWDVCFTILHGSRYEYGDKVNKLKEIGTTIVNLSEWVKESEYQKIDSGLGTKAFCKELPIAIQKDDMKGYAMLHVAVCLTEVEMETTWRYSPEADRFKSKSSGLRSLMKLEDEDEKSQYVNNITRSSPESTLSAKHSFLSWTKNKNQSKDFNFQVSSSNMKESSASDEEDDMFGSWQKREFISRDNKLKLRVETFFASIDQRDQSAGGEIACSAIVAVIADALHSNGLKIPSRPEFDALIREGSLEWKKLCGNARYVEQFPDKHFDLDTVIEAGIKPISLLQEKSYIGFFQPESFKTLQKAMSFDDVWHNITINADKEDPKLYIVGWNDHFFLLKVEANAFYVIDTLGERLFENCKKAYILKFDEFTEMYEMYNGYREREELICKGMDCCKEFIVGFLAAIPVLVALQLEKQGVGTIEALHQRLQIEFHLTQPSDQFPCGQNVQKICTEDEARIKAQNFSSKDIYIEGSVCSNNTSDWSSDYSWSTLNSSSPGWLSEYSCNLLDDSKYTTCNLNSISEIKWDLDSVDVLNKIVDE